MAVNVSTERPTMLILACTVVVKLSFKNGLGSSLTIDLLPLHSESNIYPDTALFQDSLPKFIIRLSIILRKKIGNVD